MYTAVLSENPLINKWEALGKSVIWEGKEEQCCCWLGTYDTETHSQSLYPSPIPLIPPRMWFGHHILALLSPPLWSQLTTLRSDKKNRWRDEWGQNEKRKCVWGDGAGDRCERGMRDTEERREGGGERMDCIHTPHTCQWLVVCGLRWIGGGRREEEWWKAGLVLILPGTAWRADAPLSSLVVRETVREKYVKVSV